MHKFRRRLAIYLSYLVSFFFIYLTLHGIDYDELGNSLASVNPWTMVLAAGLYLFTFIFRGMRLQLVLDGKIERGMATSANLICYALNNFLPLKCR